VIAAVLVAAFFVSRGCQEAQIKVTQQEAIATAKRQVDFVPQNTQIRFLRQGLDRHPFWFVSLSIPSATNPGGFLRLTLVKIDADTGDVNEVTEQVGPGGRSPEAPAGGGTSGQDDSGVPSPQP
jgi:hypothetical protein